MTEEAVPALSRAGREAAAGREAEMASMHPNHPKPNRND